MSEISNLYALLARSAGAAAYQRNSTYASLIPSLAQIPGQILADKEDQRLRQQQLDRQRAQDARATAQDARQIAEDRRASQADEYKHIVAQGLAAAVGDGSDPTQFDGQAAFSTVKQLGHPEAIRDVIAAHRAMAPQITQQDPTKDTYVDGVLTRPGVIKPPVKPDYTIEGQRFSGEGAPIGARVQPVPSQTPFTVRTMENGRPVEKVMSQADALKAGSFPSQPPASIQVNAAQAAAASAPPSKAEIAMANYMVPTPSPRSFATPAGKAMMDRILTVNPDFDASKYSVRAPTRKAFTTGMQGQQITAMNTAVEHLDQLQAAAEALKNGNFKPGNAAYQYLKETFGSNAPTNYDTIKAMVDKEVEAVANKGVPTVAGTAEQKALAGKSAGPAQLKGYIDTLIPLMGSKLNALHYQYKQAMGENDPFHVLTPEAEAILTKRGFDPTKVKVQGGGGGDLISVTDPRGGVHQFKSQAEADAFKKAAGIQ